MPDVTVRNFRPDDAPAMVALQQKSLAVSPDMDPTPAGFYGHPAFENGQNIFCAVDSGGRLIGYAILFNNPARPWYYMDIKADPELPAPEMVKDLLLARLTERTEAILSARRATQTAEEAAESPLLYGCYFSAAPASLSYLESRGFKRVEALCGYDLAYSLERPLQPCPAPEGITIQPLALATDDQLDTCLADLNRAFPNAPQERDGLSQWARTPGFGAFAALDGDRNAGVIMVLRGGEATAYIPYLWVLPEYRRRGIARALIAEALAHAKRLGVTRVTLQTGGDNQAAIALYRSAGFEVRDAEVSLGIQL
ncbi:MAG: GNAT family N-acetyltransferase [Mycobacterium leprae]